MEKYMKNLYDELENKKKSGEKLNWDEITFNELFQLSLVESIPDSMIGYLYDIDKYTVRKKRYKWNLKITISNLILVSLTK